MNNEVDVYIKLIGSGKMPVYASDSSAGCDLFAAQDMVLRPGETKLMPLDFIMAPPPDLEAQIRPRSGLSLKTGIRLPNSPGTVDSDFRDPVCVILQNTFKTGDLAGMIFNNPGILYDLKDNYRGITLRDYLIQNNLIKEPDSLTAVLNEIVYIDIQGNPYGTVYIKKDDRIAQMVFAGYKKAKFIIHEDPALIGKNRGGGFGHTGV